METRIARRQVQRMLATGAAAAGLGFSQNPRRRSLALVTNSDGNEISVIDLERLAPAGDWQVGERPHGIAVSEGGRGCVYDHRERESFEVVGLLYRQSAEHIIAPWAS
jgi:hypothetical protein